jgi:CBS domain-containing protein
MPTRNVPVESAGANVQDVMLSAPRTLAPEATAGEARAAFQNPRERLLLVARGDEFVGTVSREALPDHVADDEPLGALADLGGERVQPNDSVARALELLDADQSERLPVVSGDGTLVGLVCFNRRRGHFCVDG